MAVTSKTSESTSKRRRSLPSAAFSTSAVCGAVGYMEKLGYGGFFEESDRRTALGEEQTYCQTCGLCRWPEEQRTCSHFVRSEELEAFYEDEKRKTKRESRRTGSVRQRQPIPRGRERPLNAPTTTYQNENFDNTAVTVGIRHLFTVLDCDGCG